MQPVRDGFVRAWERLQSRTERKFANILSTYLLRQRSRVLARLSTLQPTETSFPPEYRRLDPAIANKLLPPGDEDEMLADAMEDVIENAAELGADLSIRFDELDKTTQAAIRTTVAEVFSAEYWGRIVNQNTRERIQQLVAKTAISGEGGAGALARAIRKDFFFTKKRAERIARTESTAALNGAQRVGQDRLMAEEIIDGLQWVATFDEATRPAHSQANGQVIKVGEKFTVGGFPARYPGDPNLPARQRINCFLPGTRIEGRVKAAARSWYDGQAVELKTASGSVIRVTQNHPVFTSQGTVPAGAIKIGNQLIGREHWIDPDPMTEPDHQKTPILIENIFHAISVTAPPERMRPSSFDLHGDGQFIAGQIEIVRPNWELMLKEISAPAEFCLQLNLPSPNMGTTSCRPGRTALADDLLSALSDFLPFKYLRIGFISGLNSGPPQSNNYTSTGQSDFFRDSFYRHSSPEQFYDLFSTHFSAKISTANRNPLTLQCPKESNRTDAQLDRQFLGAPPSAISLDHFGAQYDPARVISIRHFHYSGWVYDVETDTGCILAEEFTFANCRCTQISVVDLEAGEPKPQLLLPAPATPEPAPTKPKRPPRPKKPRFPDAPSKLNEVQRLGGSTGARLMEDEFGQRFVLKRGSSPEQIRDEFAAEAIYRAAGIKVPDSKLYETKEGPVKLSKWIDGTTLKDMVGDDARRDALEKIREGFATDSLVANWDVIGLDDDNILIDKKGNPFRIDVGGSLRFRAQGGPKPNWNENVTELWSLQDANVNRSSSRVFAKLGADDKVKQIDKLLKRRMAVLNTIEDPELKGVIEARFEQLREISGTMKTLRKDAFRDLYTDEYMKHRIGIREAGISRQFPQELNQSSFSPTTLIDENEMDWDHLRSNPRRGVDRSIVTDLEDYINKNGGDYRLIKGWAQQQAGSSWSERSQMLKWRIANEYREVGSDAYYWRSGPEKAKMLWDEGPGARVQGITPEAYDNTFTAYHAFVNELLGSVKMKNSNLKKKTVKLMRTEDRYVLIQNGIEMKEKNQTMKRGPAESFSLYKPTWISNSLTRQEVPHHRVIGFYGLERTPGQRDEMFYGDSENELVVIPDGIPFQWTRDRR